MSFEIFRKTRMKSEELCGKKKITGGKMGCGPASKRKAKRQKSQEGNGHQCMYWATKHPYFFCENYL